MNYDEAEPDLPVTLETLRDFGLCRVYVAGPLGSAGLAWRNVRKAVMAGQQLLEKGFIPEIPHLSIFHDMICPNSEEVWRDLAIKRLRICHALVYYENTDRGGPTIGFTAREWECAGHSRIPCFPSLDVFFSCVASGAVYPTPDTREGI